MERKNQIGIFIKQRREELGLSRAELAKRVGHNWPNMVAMIENGNTPFPINSWEKFAEALEVSKKEFLQRVLAEKYPAMLPYFCASGKATGDAKAGE